MAVDFSIDDTEVYTEAEREFSAQAKINELLEWKRSNTPPKINSLQKGLIPQLLDITWNKTDTYFKNGVYAVSRDYFETCLHVNGIVNNIFHNESMGRFFCEKMVDGYNNSIVQPFLLFINRIHIAWSRITVVRSDFNISLLISGMDKDLPVNDVQIISIPFKVIYTEGKDELPDKKIMYRFDKNGLYSYDSSIFVYADTPNIIPKLYNESRYKDYDMGIPNTEIVTADNLILFDNTGRLEFGVPINIKHMNLLTLNDSFIQTHYISCCYSAESNLNEDVTTRIGNKEFETQLVNGTAAFEILDKSTFLSDFDFDHDKTLPYDTNIANSLDYVFGYDENKLDPVFEALKPVNIVQYDANALVRRFNTDGKISMLKDVYQGDNLEAFPMIFHNGLLPSYYSSIQYTQSSFSFVPSGINYSDSFEIAYFKGVDNTLIKLDIANKSQSDYLNIRDYYIPKDDIVVYSACRGETNLFPINYTIDGNNNIVLNNPRYLEGQLYIGSRNQFIYERFVPSSNTNKVTLSTKFRTAYNAKKFMVFINGRYVNSALYRVLIPSLNNGKITSRAIYTMKTIKPTDRVDIFYCSTPKLSQLSTNGDLFIYCIKNKSSIAGQRRFKVPYPFKNYPREYDSFFCIKNSARLDRTQYTIDGDYIEFVDTEDYSDFGKDLIFVFPYYKPSWLSDTNINVGFISRYTRAASNTNTITFTADSHGSVIDKSMVHLFADSTYIEPSRYSLISNDTVRFTSETISKDTLVTMVVETDKAQFADNNIRLETVSVSATEDGQYIFDIPKPEFYDSFFVIKDSLLVSPNRYFVTDQSKIIFVNDFDKFAIGTKLLFVFAKDKDSVNPDNKVHVTTDFIYIRPTSDTVSISLSSDKFPNLKFTKENILAFVNSSYISNDRFTVNNNILTLTTTGDIFRANKSIVIAIAYRTLNYTKAELDVSKKEMLKFQDIDVTILQDGQTKFTIPYPLLPFTDTEFMLSIANTFINPDNYTINGMVLTILDGGSMKKGHKLRFTFVHNGGYTHIAKRQVNVTITANQTEVDIPAPYNKLVSLTDRMILTFGSVYIDKDRYLIDSKTRKISLIDFPLTTTDTNRTITFTFFLTGNEYNGGIAYLPQSGYICFLKGEVVSNYNKEMYMAFINGRKLCKSELLDISNTMVKVSTDVKRRYDLVILNCSPTITELKPMYINESKWSKMLDPLPI